MDEKKVKGTMLLDFVRMIRQNKDKDWNKYLKPEDWEIINSSVMVMKWYPLDVYKRCGLAAFMLIAEGNLDLARLWGRVSGQEMFSNTYKSVIATKDPESALDRFVSYYSLLFNFSTLKLEKIEKNHVKIHHDYDPNDKSNVPYCHQLMGILDILVELTGGKDPKVDLTAKQWEGAPQSVFDIRWV